MTADPSRWGGPALDRRSRGGRVFLFAYTLICGLLVWQIVASAMAGGLESASPQDARRWRPRQAEALIAQAQEALNVGDLPTARKAALKALRASPALGVAYRILGQAAEYSGNQPKADQLYAQAWRLTHRDATLASILMEKALTEGRYDDALEKAEIVVRRAPPLTGVVVRRLAGLASEPAAQPALVRKLSGAPEWRRDFFREMARRQAFDEAIALYAALEHTPAPPTDDEFLPVIREMIWNGRSADARAAWVASLPAPQRPGPTEIYNGNFKLPAHNVVFDWKLPANANVRARLPERGEPGGLLIQTSGLPGGEVARQLIVLEPGRYLLSSRAHATDGDGFDVQWRLTCGEDPLGPPLTLRVGRRGVAEGEVEVAREGQGCDATLHLYALDRERGDAAAVVIDSVRLRPAGD